MTRAEKEQLAINQLKAYSTGWGSLPNNMSEKDFDSVKKQVIEMPDVELDNLIKQINKNMVYLYIYTNPKLMIVGGIIGLVIASIISFFIYN